jgi:hypothetical protein
MPIYENVSIWIDGNKVSPDLLVLTVENESSNKSRFLKVSPDFLFSVENESPRQVPSVASGKLSGWPWKHPIFRGFTSLSTPVCQGPHVNLEGNMMVSYWNAHLHHPKEGHNQCQKAQKGPMGLPHCSHH